MVESKACFSFKQYKKQTVLLGSKFLPFAALKQDACGTLKFILAEKTMTHSMALHMMCWLSSVSCLWAKDTKYTLTSSTPHQHLHKHCWLLQVSGSCQVLLVSGTCPLPVLLVLVR